MALVIICRQIDISVGSQFSVCSVARGAARGASLAGGARAAGVHCDWRAARGVQTACSWPGCGCRPSSSLFSPRSSRCGRDLRTSCAAGRVFVGICPTDCNGSGSRETAGQWTPRDLGTRPADGLRRSRCGIFPPGALCTRWAPTPRRQGLPALRPQVVTFAVFVLMGALTGLAAMMNIIQSPQVQPLSGSGLELKVIAAVVVGSAASSISGGRGNLWEAASAGLLLLGVRGPGADASAHRGLLGKGRAGRDHPARRRGRWIENPEG